MSDEHEPSGQPRQSGILDAKGVVRLVGLHSTPPRGMTFSFSSFGHSARNSRCCLGGQNQVGMAQEEAGREASMTEKELN
ncbi:MAG TPA: hypothetical protein VNH84_08880, partial [Candidatus Saccharimonadales bacterium]|nr:hypothetical protein [Candidatus Saccharimonadales bacterium]